MTFEDMLKDLNKLVGLKLQSIRPGAEIIILSIDVEHDNLLLKTSTGNTKSRPLRELRTIWELMMQKPYVHVDEALHGSGTSRNQPETMLANLPYVEWLKVKGQKNLAYVNKETHPFGTLREMDVFQADDLISRSDELSRRKTPNGLIVTNEISATIDLFCRRCSGTVKMLVNGVYSYLSESNCFYIVSANMGLEEGTYLILRVNRLPRNGKTIVLAGKEYELVCFGDVKALLTY